MQQSELLSNIDNPGALEKLYQHNKSAFKTEFNLLYPQITNNPLATFWHERLNYESADISWGSKSELAFVVIASLIAGFIAKLPALFNLNEEYYYQRNSGFIAFPMLTAYFIWKNKLSTKQIVIAAVAYLVALLFINLLPANDKSDTLLLSCMHLPILLWAVVGFAYVGNHLKSYPQRLDFLRYNGDLVIMTTLILIAGGILTGLTIGLFGLIGFKIEQFYTHYIVVSGLAAAPVIATYITQTNPHLVNRVSPVIAKIFSPLVLITLTAYLVAILFSAKDPYTDRDFLLIFNLLLIGVMAIIFFSVAETFKKNETRVSSFILFALSVVTLLVNGIALSAILFRISEWGITPNRLAVLGENVLMLTNLLVVAFKLYKNIMRKADIGEVENSISFFLSVYIIWIVIVTFIFPFLFQFK